MAKKEIDKYKFIDLYLNKGYSTRDLAVEFNIGQTTVRRRLKEWEVPTRTSREGKQTTKFKEKHVINSKKLEKNITKICLHCQQEFITKPHLNAKFCSRACYLAKEVEDTQIEVECTECGKRYLTSRRNLQYDNKFCSYECQGKYKSKTFAGENSPFYNRIERTCGYCGKTLLVPKHKSQQEKVYCNKQCMALDYQTRLTGENNPHWSGGKASYYGSTWLKQRDVCRERDNYTCQKCGITEKDLGHQLSVHHIKLFRLYEYSDEANHIDNLVALCPACHTFVHSNKNIHSEFLNI